MKSNTKDICIPLVNHVEATLKDGFSDYQLLNDTIMYKHDGALFEVLGPDNSQYEILKVNVLQRHDYFVLNCSSSFKNSFFISLYSNLINHDLSNSHHYLNSVIRCFFDIGSSYQQFSSHDYFDYSLSLESLMVNSHIKRSRKRQLAIFNYSSRIIKEESVKTGKSIKRLSTYGACSLSIAFAIKKGILIPVYIINIPIHPNFKFYFSLPVNEEIDNESLQLLLFKFEKKIREQIFQTIKRNKKMKGHESIGEIKTYSCERLMNELTLSEMINY